MPILFGPQTCTDLAAGASREWLVPDGCGGYAMGTVSGLRTRRYHGLLVLADGSPARRLLSVASLDPVVTTPGGAQVRLGTHEWADGTIAPAGHELLERFDLDDGLPRWRWRIGDVVVERELAARHGSPVVGVVHRLLSGGPVELTLEALVTWRDVHGERTAWGPPPQVAHTADGPVVEGRVTIRGPGWEPDGQWYRGVRTRAEEERGLSAVEDLWLAGRFRGRLAAPGASLEVVADGVAAMTPAPAGAVAGQVGEAGAGAADLVRRARARARALVSAGTPHDPVGARLVLAADAFVTTAPDVVAGYPWFGAWSRDTMTSYEGLLLETGRAEEGRRLLLAHGATVSEGMLANTADTGSTEYNTVDGTLWFVHALGRHVSRTGDLDLACEILPVLDGVVGAHLRGTRYGIVVDEDGLLVQGADGAALTWMDARVGGTGVTARRGKPVEVNALWIRALATCRGFRRAIGRDDSDLVRLEATARKAFVTRFQLPDGSLADVVDTPAGPVDAAVRPNQVIAAALVPGLIGISPVLSATAGLLTPLGLRSLDPGDRAYRPRHRGGPAERDSAYHQGTVWPWLIGPWTDAALAAGMPGGAVACAHSALEAHLSEAGLGSVSETADAAAPHGTTGCPFQAWSVAELLRARRRVHDTMEDS